jgi:hypothetical protein
VHDIRGQIGTTVEIELARRVGTRTVLDVELRRVQTR